jgi:hypothetical protein
MLKIDEIMKSGLKPKETEAKLQEALVQKAIPFQDFISYFESASKTAKGICADVIEQISKQNAEMLLPYLDTLIPYINYDLPKVKWGIPEAVANMAKDYPEQAAKAVPYLLKNTVDDPCNPTVIRWCASFALTEIAKYNLQARKQLMPVFDRLINTEQNSGVKNKYVKAVKIIEKMK